MGIDVQIAQSSLLQLYSDKNIQVLLIHDDVGIFLTNVGFLKIWGEGKVFQGSGATKRQR